ncbi:RiPP maturation radical SAM C-methyltransferase [Chitinophaga rupis]|nr:RiPP maturation radical SAM C-methyltransferase [Chitinophaga rupis]
MKIALVNMPFADFKRPSIAIAQLKTVIGEKSPDIEVQEIYLNSDVAAYLSPDIYEFISLSGPSNTIGFGDWFFRQQAFPELEDNTAAYFDRYGIQLGQESIDIYYAVIKEKREQLGTFLQQMIDQYQLTTYDIVGFTSMFMQNVPSFALARLLKAQRPGVTVIMGGANCEAPMGEEIVRQLPFIDYTFSGPALISLPAFLDACLQNDEQQKHRINGVFSKRNCSLNMEDVAPGQWKPVAPVGQERPINDVVAVDYDFFMEQYNNGFAYTGKKPYLLFETSRGCWWGAKAHCTFCGLNGGNMGYRAIGPAKAIEYINGLFQKYKHQVDLFSCVDNIIPKEYFTDVFPLMKVPDNISIFYEVKADLLEDQMQVLVDARILQIQPGIESLDTSTLKLMRKGTTAFNNIRLLKYCIQYGVEPYWNLLIGFPGEQEETYERYAGMLENLYHLPPPAGVFPVRFDRYSPYFTKADSYGLDLHPLDYYSFIYPFEATVMSNMAYYFADHNYNSEYIRHAAKWVQRLQQIVTAWGERWKRTGDLPVLKLLNEHGRQVIFDTRHTYERYVLSPVHLAILEVLSTHKNKAAAFNALPGFPQNELEEGLAFLFEKGLIFEEKGSMLSLIPATGIHDVVKTGEVLLEA